jgi:hypothetical protein
LGPASSAMAPRPATEASSATRRAGSFFGFRGSVELFGSMTVSNAGQRPLGRIATMTKMAMPNYADVSRRLILGNLRINIWQCCERTPRILSAWGKCRKRHWYRPVVVICFGFRSVRSKQIFVLMSQVFST